MSWTYGSRTGLVTLSLVFALIVVALGSGSSWFPRPAAEQAAPAGTADDKDDDGKGNSDQGTLRHCAPTLLGVGPVCIKLEDVLSDIAGL